MTASEPRDASPGSSPASPLPDGSGSPGTAASRPAAREAAAHDVSYDDGGGGVLSRRFRALTLGIISVVSLIAFEASAIGTAMPVAAQALHGVESYGFAFSAFFTASLFAMTLSGEWSDRSGPLAPLFTGIGAFTAGLVIAGTAPTMPAFIAGRAVQGAGGGLVIVALYVVVGRGYPERLRPSVMAAFSAAWVLPLIVGPLVAGTVTEQLGWRWVFLAIPVFVLPPLAVMLPALRKLPADARTPAMDRRRILLALGVAAGAGLLQYAGREVEPLALLPAAAGIALLVPCAVRLLPAGTFRAGRGLPAVVLLRGITAGSFFGAQAFVPLMLVTERGLSATLAGLSLTSAGLAWSGGSYVQSRPRLEPYRERLMTLGTSLMALAVGGVSLALFDGVPAWIVAPWWVVGGFGMGLTIASATVLLLKLSRPEEAGTNSAALQVSDSLGNIVLVGGSGVLFAALGGGSVAEGGQAVASSGEGRPVAFAAVFAAMTLTALAGVLVTTRLRPGARAAAAKGPAA
ncbi:MFS transporter [Streptomyces sp. NPDC051776]|uniref:MFS transporter n=1 Tax=Streptomyces sp. NPDC051776 TaxID=3155414 RepID=UPI0034315259